MLYNVPMPENGVKFYRTVKQVVKSDIEVIEFGYNRMPPGKYQAMKRNVFILHYITAGKGMYMDTPFDKNCCYYVVPQELEKIRADNDEPYESGWVMFKGDSARALMDICNMPEHNSVIPFNKNQECMEIIQKVLFETEYENEAVEAFIMNSAFYKILSLHMGAAYTEKETDNCTAKNIGIYIQKNYDQEIKISDIAEKFHYSRNYLYTIFKDEYGISPQEYLLLLRIEKAKQLMEHKSHGLTIKEIAYSAGFRDPLYFSRIFRRRIGMSPSEYINNIK